MNLRLKVQILSAAIMNCGIKWQPQALRGVCIPVLNCWACPGAVFGCPLGTLGQLIAGMGIIVLFFFGIVLVAGAALGRLWCGWVCPFGLLQDFLYKIPTPKLKLPTYASYLRYIVLIGPVILVPIFLGQNSPFFFCRFCPAGRLEAGIPALFLEGRSPHLWRVVTLAAFVLFMIFVHRGFCANICPLGAILGLFNKVSLYRMGIVKELCKDCGKCATACQLGIDPRKDANSTRCIRCLKCKAACPFGAIWSGFKRPE